jgi:HAD superfamily hydrolase (TIGR01484 family)
LRRRGATEVSAGDVIVATWHPFENQVLESIREAALELQVIFNKDAVMILPSGVNKMTGLCAALAELRLSRHNVIGIGDAENDHAFLDKCERSIAVANAIPALKEKADL